MTRMTSAVRPAVKLLACLILLTPVTWTQIHANTVSVAFQENNGQAHSHWEYLLQTPGYQAAISNREILLLLSKTGPRKFDAESLDLKQVPKTERLDIKLSFIGGRNDAVLTTQSDSEPGALTYFSMAPEKSGPSLRTTSVNQYQRIGLSDLYPGIDLLYKIENGSLRYDFEVAQAEAADAIRMKIEGVEALRVDQKGNLILNTALGSITQKAPISFQMINGMRQPVTSRYKLLTKNTVGFELADYADQEPLVIDPTIEWSTFLGGQGSEYGLNMKKRADDTLVVAGSTTSMSFPMTLNNQYGVVDGINADVFVSKLSADGSNVLFTTILTGTAEEIPFAVEIDNNGDIIVAGRTRSTDFPLLNPIDDQFFPSGTTSAFEGFIAKIDGDTGQLIYSTYLGGDQSPTSNDFESIYNLALDETNNHIFFIGNTSSTDFPTTHNFNGRECQDFDGTSGNEREDFVIGSLDSNGALISSVCLGGSGRDRGRAITMIPGSDRVAITGRNSGSDDFPVTGGAYLTAFPGNAYTSVAAILNKDLTNIVSATYIDSLYIPKDIKVNSENKLIIAGYNFAYPPLPPVLPNGHKTTVSEPHTLSSGGIGFTIEGTLLKFSADLSNLESGTYVGGSNFDFVNGIQLDERDRVYTIAYTKSHNYPVSAGAIQATTSSAIGDRQEIIPGAGSLIANDLQFVGSYLDTTSGDPQQIGLSLVARAADDGTGAANQLIGTNSSTDQVDEIAFDTHIAESVSVALFGGTVTATQGNQYFIVGNCDQASRVYNIASDGTVNFINTLPDASFCAKAIVSLGADNDGNADLLVHDGSSYKLFLGDGIGGFAEATLPTFPIVSPSVMRNGLTTRGSVFLADKAGPDLIAQFDPDSPIIAVSFTPFGNESLATTAAERFAFFSVPFDLIAIGYEGHPVEVYKVLPDNLEEFTVGREDTINTFGFSNYYDEDGYYGIIGWEQDVNGDTIATCYCYDSLNELMTFGGAPGTNLGQVGSVLDLSIFDNDPVLYSAEQAGAAITSMRMSLYDIALSVYSADLSSVVYSTYLGGQLLDANYQGLVVEQSGVFIAAGTSESSDFPLVNGSMAPLNGISDAVITKIDFRDLLDDDLDGITNDLDNCTYSSNPAQVDTDGDGFGNACDGDFNQDGIVNFLDYPTLTDNIFSTTSPLTDLNADGSTNFLDVGLFANMIFTPPGPSAQAP